MTKPTTPDPPTMTTGGMPIARYPATMATTMNAERGNHADDLRTSEGRHQAPPAARIAARPSSVVAYRGDHPAGRLELSIGGPERSRHRPAQDSPEHLRPRRQESRRRAPGRPRWPEAISSRDQPLRATQSAATLSTMPIAIFTAAAAARPSTAPHPALAATSERRALVYSNSAAPTNAPTKPPTPSR